MTHLLHNRFVHAPGRSLLHSSRFRCDNNVAVTCQISLSPSAPCVVTLALFALGLK